MLPRCALVLCALAASLAPPCLAREPAQEPPNAVLLVAKPNILDPNFSQTVVLVTQTREAETVGVILNRPTPLAASELLPPGLPSGNYHDSVYFGGPVLRQAIVALFHSDGAPPAPAFHVLKDVYLSMHPDNIEMLLESKHRRYRLYVGFAGWAPGQLEAELAGDGWYVLPAEDDVLFRKDTAGLWRELVLKASGPRAALPLARVRLPRQAAALDWALSKVISPPR
jgi:putative transcriptional regulator